MYACRFDPASSSLCRVADLIPLMVSVVDRDGRYRYVNRHYAAYFGRPAADFPGRHVTEVIDLTATDTSHAERAAALRDCIDADSEIEFVTSLRRPGGSERRVLVKLVGHRDDGVCHAFLTDLGEDALSERLERHLVGALARRY